ncbi:MAG: fumarylacetoacetate hydrolase family protein, partial [Chloroflexota bacterium]
MKVAHVRERFAPAGAPWRLAVAVDVSGGGDPDRWIDLEQARRRAIRRNAALEHDSGVHRRPVTTLDDHLAAGLRVEALRDLLEGFEPRDDDDPAVLDTADLAFGPPILHPPSLRDFYAFEGHAATGARLRGRDLAPEWYEAPAFYFSNPASIRGPGEPVARPAASRLLDFELEIAAVIGADEGIA